MGILHAAARDARTGEQSLPGIEPLAEFAVKNGGATLQSGSQQLRPAHRLRIFAEAVQGEAGLARRVQHRLQPRAERALWQYARQSSILRALQHMLRQRRKPL